MIQDYLLKLATILSLICFGSIAVSAQTINNDVENKLDASNELILTAEEKQWIIEHPVVSASNNTALAPFDFIIAGYPAGISIDYINLIAIKVGLNIDFVNSGSWNKTLEKAKNKEIDIMHTISKNKEREEYFNFSASYFDVEIVNFGRIGSEKVNNISDLEGKRVGIVIGHLIGGAYKQNHPHLNLIEFDTHTNAISALALGKIDVYTGSAPAIEFFISQNNIQGIEIIGADFVLQNKLMDQRIAVHKDNPILMAIINKAIAAITDEELRKITQKWIKASPVNYDIGLTEKELDWLSKNKVIKVGVDPTVPPHEIIDENGKISGISGNYLDIIAERLNIEFEWAGSRNWDEAMSMIESGEADILSSVASNPARRERFLFTDVYLESPNVIFSKMGGQVFGNIDSLSGYKIAQIKGFSISEFLRTNYPAIEIIEVASTEEAMQKVSSGEVDAYVGDIPTGVETITSEGITNIVVSGNAFAYKGGNAMATRMDLPLLASAMQKVLKSVTIAQQEEIERRWLFAQVAAAPDYKQLRQFGLIALIIIAVTTIGAIIILMWNKSLRREVNKRKISEERFRQIAETVDGVFFTGSPNLSKVKYLSPNFEKWSNHSCQEVYDDPMIWSAFIHPYDRELFEQAIQAAVESNFTAAFPDYRIIDRAQSVRWLSTQAYPVRDKQGKIVNIVGFMTDITERKIAAEKLDEINNQLQNSFTHAPHGMALVAIGGNFLAANEALCKILGYSRRELLNLNFHQFTPPDEVENSNILAQELLDDKRESYQLDQNYLRKDGKFIPTQLSVSLVRDHNDKPIHFICQVQDLSMLREREDQLRHSQKMEAVGKLTGGIAHDFNNILGIILGNLEILKALRPHDTKITERVDKAISGIDRGSNLVSKLLGFSRKASHSDELVMINEHIMNLEDFITKSLTVSVDVKFSLAENLWPIKIDASDLEDAIINIALNARDAMPNGGKLFIETDNKFLDEKYVEQNPTSKVGEYVMISISDTGDGIDDNIIDKILEPFFTTKKVDKGTGLGLSMVHGFVQRSGGHMKIFSELDKGTTFKIYIPRSFTGNELDNDKPTENTSHLHSAPLHGDKHTLIADDEKL